MSTQGSIQAPSVPPTDPLSGETETGTVYSLFNLKCELPDVEVPTSDKSGTVSLVSFAKYDEYTVKNKDTETAMTYKDGTWKIEGHSFKRDESNAWSHTPPTVCPCGRTRLAEFDPEPYFPLLTEAENARGPLLAERESKITDLISRLEELVGAPVVRLDEESRQ